MPETQTRTTRTAALAAGLRALADFLDTHDGVLPEPRYLEHLNVWHPENAGEDGAIVAAAEDAGLPVTVTTHAGLDTITVRFGELVAQGLVAAPRQAGEDR